MQEQAKKPWLDYKLTSSQREILRNLLGLPVSSLDERTGEPPVLAANTIRLDAPDLSEGDSVMLNDLVDDGILVKVPGNPDNAGVLMFSRHTANDLLDPGETLSPDFFITQKQIIHWLRNGKTPPSLEGLDFSGLKFDYQEVNDRFPLGVSLRGCNFMGADMYQVTLVQSDLSLAVFRGAHLSRASLIDCTIRDTDFSRSNLFNASFIRSRDSGVKANFDQAFMNQVNMTGLNLDGSSFVRTDMQGAKLAGTIWTEVNLFGIRAQNAILTNARFSFSTMDKVDFSHADMQGASITESSITDGHFNSAKLTGATIKPNPDGGWGTIFNQADLRGADLQGGDFNEASFRGADLKGATMATTPWLRTTFGECMLADADLNKADLSGTDLTDAILESSRADGTRIMTFLHGAILEGTIMEPETMRNLSQAGMMVGTIGTPVLHEKPVPVIPDMDLPGRAPAITQDGPSLA